MPIINMPLDLLLRLVNTKRELMDESRVSATLERMGVEVEELTSTNAFACLACENVLERTEAQGEPLACPKCGADFRERPDARKRLAAGKVARLNMLAVRPDIFDPGGMARYMRGFLGERTGLVEYAVAAPRLSVKVDPRLSRDESFRPCIACAALRNVRLDNERIKLLMNLQEDLHWALGRDRKLASIGVYDLDKLSERGPAFQYRAVGPGELRFVPLGMKPEDPAANLTPSEILTKHKTGVAYAHLLAKFSAYPLLTDGDGKVLSMPPIINSEATRVTMSTRQCFVDVTGLAQRTVDRALNILVTGLKEALPELQVEAVRIEHAEQTLVTPDLAPAEMTLEAASAADTIGVSLDAPELAKLLERMGHAATVGRGGRIAVCVPAWRNDVMHPIDLIEDAAIAHGYDNLVPRLVPTFTVGRPRELEERCALVRRALAGLGLHQVMTLPLTCEAAAFEKWGVGPDPRAVKIENPISSEQTIGRVSLLPGLLETLSINKQYELPQTIFEVGDVTLVDDSAETGAVEERRVAAAMIGTHVGYADVRAVGDALAHEMGLEFRYGPTTHASYIPGRVAAVSDALGRPLGLMGELHPRVLENYGLRHAAAVFEISLAPAPAAVEVGK